MADIFTKTDALKLLKGKSVWFFGDSNMRAIYKDIIWLLEQNTLIQVAALRGKLEKSFMRDSLVKGGTLHRGRNFQEIRHYRNFKENIFIEYMFLTQCFSQDIQDKLKNLKNQKDFPDVIILNSCLWDITRWGPDSVERFKTNIISLLELLKVSLPSKCKVIWTTTPPISNDPKGGFFIKQIEFLKHTLRFDVMEANEYVSRAVVSNGFDVLDIHYHLVLQIHRRQHDGIHWNPEAVRHITNLILTHICISWTSSLPGNFKTPLLNNAPNMYNNMLPAIPEVHPAQNSKAENEVKPNNCTTKKKRKNKRGRGKNKDLNGNFGGVKRQFENMDYCLLLSNKRFKTGFR